MPDMTDAELENRELTRMMLSVARQRDRLEDENVELRGQLESANALISAVAEALGGPHRDPVLAARQAAGAITRTQYFEDLLRSIRSYWKVIRGAQADFSHGRPLTDVVEEINIASKNLDQLLEQRP